MRHISDGHMSRSYQGACLAYSEGMRHIGDGHMSRSCPSTIILDCVDYNNYIASVRDS